MKRPKGEPPRNLAASVKARLMGVARERKEDFNFLRECFYPYALTRRSTQLCLFVRESEWFGLEAAMRPLLPSEQLTAARQDFFRGLVELDDPSPVTTLRRIKNRVLATVAATEKTSVERAWEQAVQLLEVGERALGLELFLGNLDDADLRIDPGVRKILEDLAAQWGATLP